MRETLQRTGSRVELGERQLEAFSPFAVLRRGYSITRLEGEETPLTEAGTLAPGTRLETRLASGEVTSSVEEVRAGDEARDAEGEG